MPNPYRGTAFTFDLSLHSATTGRILANPTLAAGDVKVIKDEGASANITTLPSVSPAAGGNVIVALSSTEMTADRIVVLFRDQTSPAEWLDVQALVLPEVTTDLVIPAGHVGDFAPNQGAFRFTFRTANTLSGTPVLSCYKDAGTTETTTGVALSADFDSRTGLNLVTVTPSADLVTFAEGSSFSIVITTGTVNGVSVVGTVVGTFTVNNAFASSYATVDTAASSARASFRLKQLAVTPESGGTTALVLTGEGIGAGAAITSGSGAEAVAFDVRGNGTGASHAIYAAGSDTGAGGYITSGLGAANAALRIVAAGTGLGHGVFVDGVGTGHGGYIRSGTGATGDGLRAETRATNGSGFHLIGIGTGAALTATNSTGNDVNAVDGVWPVSTILTGAITSASFAAGAIDAAAIAANAIGASELAADAVAEIQSGLATAAALATVQADTDDIQARLPAALVGGRMDSSVGAVEANAITAAAIAAGAIDADALAADAVAEIADGVWDEAQSGHTTAGTFGKYLDIEVSSRLAPTVSGRTLDVTTGGAAGIDWANVEGQATAVNLSATNIDTDQVVASVTGNVGGNVTGTIGGLTAAALADFFDTNSGTTYGAAVAGSVVKEIADNATGVSASAASTIADAVWDEARSGHVAGGTFGEGVASVVGSVGSVATGGITAASFAASAVNAAALAADAVAEVADGVWDEARAGHVTAGTFGEYVTADVQLMDGSTTAADNLRRSALLMLPGTVGVGSSPSVIVTTAAAGLDTNALKDRTIVWEGNVTAALKYEPAVVTLSTGTNITLDRSLTTAPASGDTFMVV